MTMHDRFEYALDWLLAHDPRSWKELLATHFNVTHERHVNLIKATALEKQRRGGYTPTAELNKLVLHFTARRYTTFIEEGLEKYPNICPWTTRARRTVYDPQTVLTDATASTYDHALAHLALSSP